MNTLLLSELKNLALDALSSRRVTDCLHQSLIWAGERWRYDDLPHGQVSLGLPTHQIIERRNANTGASLGEYTLFERAYDLFGNVIKVVSTRGGVTVSTADDVSRTLTYEEYDSFHFVPRFIKEYASDVELPQTLTYTIDPVFLAPTSAADDNKVTFALKYDSFGRPWQATYSSSPDGPSYMLGETLYLGDDPADPLGRRVSTRSFDSLVLAASYVSDARPPGLNESTTFLDEFGSIRSVESPLGTDYDGKVLINESRLYDRQGRIKFVADPIEKGSPDGTTYGTSYLYFPDGRIRCVVRGVGYQSSASPSESADRYPTCFDYKYANHQAIQQVRGSNELLTTTPQAGAWDEIRSSAIGRTLSSARFNLDGRIEYAEYVHDRLGLVREIRRFKRPADPASPKVLWIMVHDSLGRLLSVEEPTASVVTTNYDEWGGPFETTWLDTTVSPSIVRGSRQTYDGFGRMKRWELTANGAVDPAYPVYDYHYDSASTDPKHDSPTNVRGRLSWVEDTGGGPVLLTYFGYDALGRTTSTTYWDEVDGHLLKESRQLTPSGKLVSLRFQLPDTAGSNEQFSYKLDSAGRVRNIDWFDVSGKKAALFHANNVDSFGHYLRVTFGNGFVEQYGYRPDRRRELQQMSVTRRRLIVTIITGVMTVTDG